MSKIENLIREKIGACHKAVAAALVTVLNDRSSPAEQSTLTRQCGRCVSCEGSEAAQSCSDRLCPFANGNSCIRHAENGRYYIG